MSKINRKAGILLPPQASFVAIGGGKSAYFYASNLYYQDDFFILTNHPSSSVQVTGGFPQQFCNPIMQGDLEQFKKYLQAWQEIPRRPLILLATTNPQKYQEWLENILQDVEISQILHARKDDILCVVPHLPNDAVEILRKENFAIIACDYFQGIGSVSHDALTATAQATFGAKEEVLMAQENIDKFREKYGYEYFEKLLHYLTLNKNIVTGFDIEQLQLLPTNAILHLAGIPAHIAKVLVDKKIANPQILQAKNSEEFFSYLNEALQDKNISETIGASLQGIGFYRQVPAIGPNILMQEMGDIVCKLRQKLIDSQEMRPSDLDQASLLGRPFAHINNHLRSKYLRQFQRVNQQDPCAISLAEFINHNPPYQNPAITVPVDAKGMLNVEHRFFSEEMPTFLKIQDLARQHNISEEELKPLNLCIDFISRLMHSKEQAKSSVESPQAVALDSHKLRSKL